MSCNFCHNPWCNGGSLCQNNITNGLRCWDKDDFFPDTDDQCGCVHLVNSSCVFFSGSKTSCLGIATNSTLTSVITAIDKAICNLPPSGTASLSCTTVTGTSGQIVSNYTAAVVGCGNYQISLDNSIINQINTNTTNISTLSGEISGLVSSVVTGTPGYLSISGPTGGVVTINYIAPPSGISGIVYSDYTDSTTAGTLWTSVKTYTISPGRLVNDGDKLVFVTRFECDVPTPASPSTIRMEFAGNLILQFQFVYTNLNAIDLELWIVRTSNTTVQMILKNFSGSDNGSYFAETAGGENSYLIPFAGLNLSTTSYAVTCDIKSNIAGDTVCKYLEVEYKKKVT